MAPVSRFMCPAAKCIVVGKDCTLRGVADAMLSEKCSAVVVTEGDSSSATGILTKTDLVEAWTKSAKLTDEVALYMSTNLLNAAPEMTRDAVATLMYENQTHHAVVVDANGAFVGLVSSWDIAREASLDAKAWPWSREGVENKVAHGDRLW
ncbi:CBS domain [Pycnococcus provasolii]|mmetsp:Transcript_12643/g.31664  ORF Transcript_12643/g.31664 Transcript_12643/m.31664 type:complete len:151 (+) Transcript_12643:156-608(+)|eukprot:CAMPEP_0119193744 /NCGR_PEP_ID=MMETSP1316-20130426/3785_1 /TAXON_ID=41880 /ORGANISM="Pycnococcus provasolii, Strain RCC2336" /LENGTH=150 /DNA_ID=CAMNT_0007189023 /DNA_START=139 /DNA_END=591 /DNA_ORIENTATION=+